MTIATCFTCTIKFVLAQIAPKDTLYACMYQCTWQYSIFGDPGVAAGWVLSQLTLLQHAQYGYGEGNLYLDWHIDNF